MTLAVDATEFTTGGLVLAKWTFLAFVCSLNSLEASSRTVLALARVALGIAAIIVLLTFMAPCNALARLARRGPTLILVLRRWAHGT